MIDICDNEIIYMAQEQNDDALEYILKKYKYLIDVLMFKYNFKLSNIKADLKELYNLCYFSLIEAIYKYDCSKDSLFSTFSSIISSFISRFLSLNSSLISFFKIFKKLLL